MLNAISKLILNGYVLLSKAQEVTDSLKEGCNNAFDKFFIALLISFLMLAGNILPLSK